MNKIVTRLIPIRNYSKFSCIHLGSRKRGWYWSLLYLTGRIWKKTGLLQTQKYNPIFYRLSITRVTIALTQREEKAQERHKRSIHPYVDLSNHPCQLFNLSLEGWFRLTEFGPEKLTSSKSIQSEFDPSAKLKDFTWNLVVRMCSKDFQARFPWVYVSQRFNLKTL